MLMNASLDASSSFTALLELPPTQVVKLLRLHDSDSTAPPAPTPLDSSLHIGSNLNNNYHHHSAIVPDPPLEEGHVEVRKPAVKRKKLPKNEDEVVRGTRSKKEEISQSQLPYVLVRTRRGQATDSHSLAERARREKINARMKLLRELVPGCSKISGIALVLDEIINHVQALQRQVEFLSMQLAAVNPRMEFNLDHFMDEENTFVDGNFLHPPLEWSGPQVDTVIGFKQQWQCDTYQQPQWLKEENHLESATIPDTTHLMNDSCPDTGCMRLKQLKIEQA